MISWGSDWKIHKFAAHMTLGWKEEQGGREDERQRRRRKKRKRRRWRKKKEKERGRN